jgi:hypothetical protein
MKRIKFFREGPATSVAKQGLWEVKSEIYLPYFSFGLTDGIRSSNVTKEGEA